jgi:hypothetical protein
MASPVFEGKRGENKRIEASIRWLAMENLLSIADEKQPPRFSRRMMFKRFSRA